MGRLCATGQQIPRGAQENTQENFNGPNSRSDSAPVAMANRLLHELPSLMLDALAMRKDPLNVGVIRRSEVKRVGVDIIVTPFVQMRDKKLSSWKDDYVSQQVREHLHT